jgi:anti-sigma regulatory factor (Ser/Thr protein kinase)
LTATEAVGRFAATTHAPRAARHFVVDALQAWGFSREFADDAALVSTELATNAVVHAGSPFSITVAAGDSQVRISVRDASPIAPHAANKGVMAQSGRGLGLVAALSSDWGLELFADGKIIWAELRR